MEHRSPSQTVGDSTIKVQEIARSAPYDDYLQLWVEHGYRFSKMSSKLMSAWNTNRETAIAEYALMKNSSPETYSPSRKRIPVKSRIIINRNHSAKNSLRALRTQRRTLLGRLEQQKEALRRRIENERLEQERQEALSKAVAEANALSEAKAAAEAIAANQRQLEEKREKQAAAEAEQEKLRRAKAAAEAAAAVEATAVAEAAAAVEAAAAAGAQASVGTKVDFEATATAETTVSTDAARNSNKATNKKDRVFQAKYEAWKSGPSTEWLEDISELRNGESDPALVEVCRILKTYDAVVHHAAPFRQDPTAKKVRLGAKKILTRAINQSSGTVEQVRAKILDILGGMHQLDSFSEVSARAFGMHEFMVQVLLETNNSIAGNKELAYGLAAVVVGVTAGSTDPATMHDVVLGAIYRQCVFSRPHFPSRHKGEDIVSYRKRVGFKEGEKEEDFIHRTRAYIHLLAAIFQTNISMLQTPALGPKNPYPITYGWTWLARIVNRRQRTMIPDVVHAFLETAGYAMSLAFGEQFPKLMNMVEKSVVSHASPHASALSISNMEIMLAEFKENGNRFPTIPKGRDMPLRDRRNE